MTDPDVVAKKLARITTAVHELKTLARPEQIGNDVLQERFVEHTLQIAIQAAMDVASHVVSDEWLGEPTRARDVFTILARRNVIERPLAEKLAAMVGFRNILVHEYDDVDLGKVQKILNEDLDDLLDFADIMRARL